MQWKNLLWASLAGVVLTVWTGGWTRARTQSTEQSASAQSSSSSSSSSAPVQGSSSQAGAASTVMSPADVQALLYKIYAANFRVGDLTGALPIDQWNLSDQDRASLRQKADALRASVATLEKARSEFYNHPGDPGLAQATAAALQSLLPQIEDYAKALESTPGASYVKDYQEAASGLRELDRQIEPYVAHLNPSAVPGPSAPAAQAPPQSAPASAPAQTQTVQAQAPVPAEAPKVPAPNQAGKNQIPDEAGQAQAAVQPAQAPAAQSPPPNAAQPAQTPPQSEQPSAPTPAPSATSAAAAPSHPAVPPIAMQPAEAQALLYKIYVANFRLSDLTASLGINQWKLGDEDRAALSQKAEAIRAAAANVEKARTGFYDHPDELDLGQGTTTAIQSLLPKIDEFVAALPNTPGANDVKDYQQAAGDLRSLDSRLEPYVAYLEAKNQPAPAAPSGPAVETEIIMPANALPPLTVAPPEKSPLSSDQLKTLLYQAYVPAFRIKDLLAQEHPDKWQIADAERTVYNDASQALAKRLDDLAAWRDKLEAHPDSLEAAFEVYAALDKVAEPAEIVAKMVGQYEDPKIGSEYGEKSRQVTEFRNQVEPYVGYLLRRHDVAIGTVERNFVTCETELTSVMRPATTVAEPMKNVLPVFRGRGRSVTRGAPAKARAHSSRKPAAKPARSKPAAAASSSGH